MEYCGCGDLAQKVERYKRRRQYIDEDVVWRYFIQSLKALEMLHGKGICHRDLKTANSFLAQDGEIKIGDMNVSKRLKKGHLQTQIGTPYYMSPEIWNNRPYNERSDIWSLGCMMYELCALRPPFVADSFPALKRAVTAGRYSSIPRKFSDALGKIIGSCLKLNPNDRPTASALLNHPDIQKKMYLDGAKEAREPLHAFPGMMQTIKVPNNMKQLNKALPKPCYADVRPNTPGAWVVADQDEHEKNLAKARKAAEAAAQAAHAATAAAAAAALAVTEAEAGVKVQSHSNNGNVQPLSNNNGNVPQESSNHVQPAKKVSRPKIPKRMQSLANHNGENSENDSHAPAPPSVHQVPRRHSKVPSVAYEPSSNPYRYGDNGRAPHAAYGNGNRYGGGYGQYGHYNPSAPKVNRHVPGHLQSYYDKYNAHQARRAAGQPSRAAPVRMW